MAVELSLKYVYVYSYTFCYLHVCIYIYIRRMKVSVFFAIWCSLGEEYLYNILELMCMFKNINMHSLQTRKKKDLIPISCDTNFHWTISNFSLLMQLEIVAGAFSVWNVSDPEAKHAFTVAFSFESRVQFESESPYLPP